MWTGWRGNGGACGNEREGRELARWVVSGGEQRSTTDTHKALGEEQVLRE